MDFQCFAHLNVAFDRIDSFTFTPRNISSCYGNGEKWRLFLVEASDRFTPIMWSPPTFPRSTSALRPALFLRPTPVAGPGNVTPAVKSGFLTAVCVTAASNRHFVSTRRNEARVSLRGNFFRLRFDWNLLFLKEVKLNRLFLNYKWMGFNPFNSLFLKTGWEYIVCNESPSPKELLDGSTELDFFTGFRWKTQVLQLHINVISSLYLTDWSSRQPKLVGDGGLVNRFKVLIRNPREKPVSLYSVFIISINGSSAHAQHTDNKEKPPLSWIPVRILQELSAFRADSHFNFNPTGSNAYRWQKIVEMI